MRRRSDQAYFRLAQQSLRDHHHDTEFIVDGAALGVRSDLSASPPPFPENESGAQWWW